MSGLFSSRKFWVTFFALVIIVIASFVPGFDFDVETAAGFTLVIVSFVIGLAVDPGSPIQKWKHLFETRKFWAAVVGIFVVFLNAFELVLPFELTVEQFITVCLTVSTYIFGVAFEKKDAGQIEALAKSLQKK